MKRRSFLKLMGAAGAAPLVAGFTTETLSSNVPKDQSFTRSKPTSLGGETAMVSNHHVMGDNPYAVTKSDVGLGNIPNF